jgi:hypothetical protein
MFRTLCLQMLNSESQIMQNPSFKVCGRELDCIFDSSGDIYVKCKYTHTHHIYTHTHTHTPHIYIYIHTHTHTHTHTKESKHHSHCYYNTIQYNTIQYNIMQYLTLTITLVLKI